MTPISLFLFIFMALLGLGVGGVTAGAIVLLFLGWVKKQ